MHSKDKNTSTYSPAHSMRPVHQSTTPLSGFTACGSDAQGKSQAKTINRKLQEQFLSVTLHPVLQSRKKPGYPASYCEAMSYPISKSRHRSVTYPCWYKANCHCATQLVFKESLVTTQLYRGHCCCTPLHISTSSGDVTEQGSVRTRATLLQQFYHC